MSLRRSSRSDIYQLTSFIKNHTKLIPLDFLEIGSRDGADTESVSSYWSIKPDNCYIIEAHPELYTNIINKYKNFNSYNFIASNTDGEILFNAGISDQEPNIGASSVFDRIHASFSANKINIKSYKMSTFMKNIEKYSFDLIKIDVEGFAFEVLQGFDDYINNIKIIQVENEHVATWHNQHVHSDIIEYMKTNQFSIMDDIVLDTYQKDTLFINNKYL